MWFIRHKMWIKLLRWLSSFIKRDEEIFYTTGAQESPEDNRDFIPGSINIDIPEQLDLREFVPERKNQGIRNSCVAHANCSAIEAGLYLKDPDRYLALSENYNYFYGRKESGLFPQDRGMYPLAALKSLKRDGICPEILLPYWKHENTVPGPVARSIAHIYASTVISYYRVYSQEDIKKSLALGNFVVFSSLVYYYWNNCDVNNPIIRLPTEKDIPNGLHCMMIIGYTKTNWIVLNSWGELWGEFGVCYLPFSYKRFETWGIETA